ncbi:LOW QUALITY PROTEIN: Hypothetical protein PHPALM_9456 [Phytophthora palmivora]|uniref:Uncharacterized protein n=1 Tax=Phytophthora palmivora TaxID=4796 RepID=A0A2P4Y784_9STRA|nr:LOW QUALITY PROTEIN: Hypothetical protein PHPALM_9456 [Phytophthora palmivora]
MAKLIIKERYDSSRIFKIDETAPDPDETSRRHSGLAQLSASFHVTAVVAHSPTRFVIPPVFILHGEVVSMEILRGLNAPGAVITTTDSGVMNKVLSSSWLPLFVAAESSPIRRPLILTWTVMALFPYFSYGLQQLTRSSFCFKSKLRTALELIKDDMGSSTISKENQI